LIGRLGNFVLTFLKWEELVGTNW